MTWPLAVSDFKAHFAREFIYGTGLDTVTDNDIQRAYLEASSNYNEDLYNTDSEKKVGSLYLSAHRLWVNINGAGGLSAVPRGRGLRGQAEYVVASKAVGQVNVTYQEPSERIKSSATLSDLWRSPFGQTWCSLFANRLIGNMAVVAGPDQVSTIPTELDQQ